MKKAVLTIILIFFVVNVNAQSSLQPYIDSLANQYLKKNHQLALIIGVNNRGKEQIFTYGETEKLTHQKPDTNSIFEIGQITQTFTSILFADLSVKGELKYDDPIQKYLPVDVPSPVYERIICKPVQNDYSPTKSGNQDRNKYTWFVCLPDPSSKPQPILICDLSTHTSGLPEMPSNLKSNESNPFAGYTKENMYDFLRGYTISDPIGYDFHYSNLGIALLGHIMELKSKQSFENLVNTNICSKIGMTQTKITLGESENKKFLTGYNKKGIITDHWTLDVMAPCAALHSNMSDMMRFLAANIGTRQTPLKDILDYTHSPRILFDNKKYGKASIALGWMVSPLDKESTSYVWQEGLTGGFASFIGFVETNHTGVVILSNSAIPVSDIGKNILQKLR